jgi:hypothetical protein
LSSSAKALWVWRLVNVAVTVPARRLADGDALAWYARSQEMVPSTAGWAVSSADVELDVSEEALHPAQRATLIATEMRASFMTAV